MRPAAKGTYVRAAILCAGSIPRAETAQFLQIVMIIAQLNFRAPFLSGSLTYPTCFIGLAGQRVRPAAAGAASARGAADTAADTVAANTVANLAN